VFVRIKHIQKVCRYWDSNQHSWSPKSTGIAPKRVRLHLITTKTCAVHIIHRLQQS